MRRISAQYAKLGMVLSMDVYDYYGNLVLEQGTRLTVDNIAALGKMGGGEIFFDDRRVDDVPVTPLMPSRLEGEAARKLHRLLEDVKSVMKSNGSLPKIDLNPIEKVIFSMVEQLFPVVMGEVNAIGCFSLRDYDRVHPVQAIGLSLLMGRKVGFTESQLTSLGVAALLENIGYLVLPPGMMDEPGELNAAEKRKVHEHPQYGYQILKDYTNAVPEIAGIVLEHHERWDGSGYPRGLKGTNISTCARILGITDTYYALASRRPHRPSYLPHEAIECIMAYNGELFDPELVLLFTKLMPLYPTGVMVTLNTGEMGIVSDAKTGILGRPTVRVCYDKDLNEVNKPFDMDLTDSEHQHRLVTGVAEY